MLTQWGMLDGVGVGVYPQFLVFFVSPTFTLIANGIFIGLLSEGCVQEMGSPQLFDLFWLFDLWQFCPLKTENLKF